MPIDWPCGGWRALAALDPDVGAVVAARDQRRREGLHVLVGRVVGPGGATDDAETVGMLYTLTSFETFDSLAGPDRQLVAVTPGVTGLVESVLQRAIHGG